VAELLARVRALIRRSQLHPAGGQEVSIGDIVIDTDQFVMRRGAVETPLTFYEVEILKLLYANQNQPVHRDTIFKKIWGMESDPTNRTVDNFIAKLRKKIETDQKKPRHLITVYGMGYKLIP
jgi:DNA-binding response OmpR family regulator